MWCSDGKTRLPACCKEIYPCCTTVWDYPQCFQGQRNKDVGGCAEQTRTVRFTLNGEFLSQNELLSHTRPPLGEDPSLPADPVLQVALQAFAFQSYLVVQCREEVDALCSSCFSLTEKGGVITEKRAKSSIIVGEFLPCETANTDPPF